MSNPKIVVKRIYDDVDDSDGKRVLVDRMWPRGVSKERAELDYWFKEVAPSADLRTWWGHDAERFQEFADRYEEELSAEDHVEQVDELIDLVHNHARVTLLYAAKDETVNHARVLQDYLRRHS
ncbi:MAG: DUF488 family protein [Yaniella sp.]|uniref:DUF488 domain-containing protein n=1 Tax=Yaniella sp. TaxID=2773929 RepID=UPI00264A0515|nr:DUF488 family protein [Yaniella sp.]MDN5704654.1 DUF488 family protein [Yaniella sp.]MDN5814638.1 DUF488 family protein [Yaniella sp.]MDN5816870.1 DUF488 family protein [Yaniella sp.]MDN5888313.1 DUF488 family protein [Yaniella sp.]MDN5912005.1 DUF488 family protein [Yaniella sp.]